MGGQIPIEKHYRPERSSLPSKNFPCISMDMLQIGALVLLGRLVEALWGFHDPNMLGQLLDGDKNVVNSIGLLNQS